MSKAIQHHQLTLFAEDSPVRTCPLPASGRAWLESEAGLWFEFHRVVAELRPQWVVVENVPGLLSSNGGRDFAVVVRGLVECGYGVAWRILDAQYFGVPQRRRRVFVVGSSGDGRAAEVLFESEGMSWDPAQGGAARPVIAGTLAPGAHAGGISGREIKSGVYTLTAHHGRSNPTKETFVFESRESRVARNGRGAPDVIAPPLKAQSGGTGKGDGSPLVFHGKASHCQSMNPGTQAPAIDASKELTVLDQTGIRRLTPTECERLQGFPGGWTAGQSDAPRYRQLGNAVAVPVIEWIGRRIVQVESTP